MTGATAAIVTEGWLIDGEPLETYARTVDSRDGWDDTPALRGDNITLLGRHGDTWRRKMLGPGRKTLTLTVHGTDPLGRPPAAGSARRAAYEAALDGLTRLVLAPRHRPLTVTRVHADGSRRQAQCEVVAALTPDVVTDDTGRVTLELAVPGGLWEDVDATAHRLATTTASGLQQLEVYSLAGQTGPCADPVVAVTGPCTSVTVRDALTGSGFSYSTALGGGDTLTVDAGAFSAVRAGSSPGGALTDLTTYDAQLLEISPAPSLVRGPDVHVTWAGASGTSSVVITARRKWLR